MGTPLLRSNLFATMAIEGNRPGVIGTVGFPIVLFLLMPYVVYVLYPPEVKAFCQQVAQSCPAPRFREVVEGFAKLREFLAVTARSSGYRSALERVYGVSPAALESEWLDWLQGYLDGGYRRSALETYDLGYAESLLAGGNYAAAQEELTKALEWLRKQEGTDEAQAPRAELVRRLLEYEQMKLAADEERHEVFFSNLVAHCLQSHRDETVAAIAQRAAELDVVGADIDAYQDKIAAMAEHGIFDKGRLRTVISDRITAWGLADEPSLREFTNA